MKKPYQKPQLTQVKIVTEEAVLAFCKSDSSIGPAVRNVCNGVAYNCLIGGS